MTKAMIDTDAVLTNMVAEAVKQGQNLRANVRNLTLQALQARELSLGQIKSVLASVTQGVNIGAATPGRDVEKTFASALTGMDEALLQAVHASQIALNQLADQGADFENSRLKKSLGELERLEDEFLKVVRQTAGSANDTVKARWAEVLKDTKMSGTETGAQVQATLEQYADTVSRAMRSGREAGFKAAHVLAQNFATLASGILIGMTEAYQSRKGVATAAKATKKR
jgi:hypothetical protein